MSAPYKPSLKFRPDLLPRPPDFGFVGDAPVPIPKHEVRLPEMGTPKTPEQVQYDLADAQEAFRVPMPDYVKVRYGKGDRNIVGDLLRLVAGEAHQLVGVTSEDATRLLTEWGYPTTMDGWTAEEWEQALATGAAEPNLMRMLGYIS